MLKISLQCGLPSAMHGSEQKSQGAYPNTRTNTLKPFRVSALGLCASRGYRSSLTSVQKCYVHEIEWYKTMTRIKRHIEYY